MENKTLLRIMVAISLIGFADAIYLTASRHYDTEVECVITKGCDIVLNSKYSEIMGIPLSAIGLVFYALIFVLVNIYDLYEDKLTLRILLMGTALGFSASMVFISIQIFILKALCIYCLLSFVSSVTLFVLMLKLNKQLKIKI